jgi:hypothetical protein
MCQINESFLFQSPSVTFQLRLHRLQVKKYLAGNARKPEKERRHTSRSHGTTSKNRFWREASPRTRDRARILKHLLEAEKSTFQEELPFQRSESTTGVQQGKLFVVVMEKILVCKLNKRKKAA